MCVCVCLLLLESIQRFNLCCCRTSVIKVNKTERAPLNLCDLHTCHPPATEHLMKITHKHTHTVIERAVHKASVTPQCCVLCAVCVVLCRVCVGVDVV